MTNTMKNNDPNPNLSMEAVVKVIKDIYDLQQIIKHVHQQVQQINNVNLTSSRLRDLRLSIDNGVTLAVKKAEANKEHLEASVIQMMQFYEFSRSSILSNGKEYKNMMMEVHSIREALMKDFETRVRFRYSHLTGEVADQETVLRVQTTTCSTNNGGDNVDAGCAGADAGCAGVGAGCAAGGAAVGGGGVENLDLMMKKVMEERAEVVMRIKMSLDQLEKLCYDMYVMVKTRVGRVEEKEIEDMENLISIQFFGGKVYQLWGRFGSASDRFGPVRERYGPGLLRASPALVMFAFVVTKPKSIYI